MWLVPMVVASFLRLVTSPKIFKAPSTIEEAVAFVDALLAVPGVQIASPGTEWPLLRQLCLDKALSANDIPDAWLAATVMQLDDHLATFDADFRKLLRRSQLSVLVTG